MATTIVIKNSSVALSAPSAGQLVQGELAVNVTDRKIYTLDGGGNVVLLAAGGSPYVTPQVIEVTDNTYPALRITQLGTAAALLVEDSTNPDSTPFVIDSAGNVIAGNTSSVSGTVTALVQVQSTGINAANSIQSYSTTNPPTVEFDRSRGALGAHTIVASGDILGRIFFDGSDGAAFIRGAQILAEVDGTPGTNDMPGRLVFSTTADGASSPTERMRIDSAGQTKFSYNAVIETTDNTNAALRITQLGTGNALLVEDSANPDSTPFVIDASGFVVAGYTARVAGGDSITPLVQSHLTSGNTGFGAFRWSANSGGTNIRLVKSRGASIGTNAIVSSGDTLGVIGFDGDDGTAFIPAAYITGAVDGTPGTNDMPGRLVFSTTADGASSPTERMRIDSSGNVGIGTASPTSGLQTVGSSSKSAFKTPNIAEVATVSATAATGTINYDVTTQSVLYYTTNASGNFTVNFRGSVGTSLNTVMQTGESISVTFLVTNGATAYYNSAIQVDGSSVTPKWQNGLAPTTGNASSIDSYTYVIIKTGSAAFTVLATQTKFA